MARTKQTAFKSQQGAADANDGDPARNQFGGKTPRRHYGDRVPRSRRTHRWRPGTVALREIKKQQKSTELIFPKAAMRRLVMGILMQTNGSGNVTRVRKHAVEALHVAAEDHLLGWFQDCLLGQIHRGKQTLQKVDAEFINILRRDHADRWRVQGSRFSK